ncbi:MAG: hypothetical protein LBQ31_06030 [Bacteroidales bacterium]|nr:hypothetical protein [Bacteroidales bacterium]
MLLKFRLDIAHSSVASGSAITISQLFMQKLVYIRKSSNFASDMTSHASR